MAASDRQAGTTHAEVSPHLPWARLLTALNEGSTLFLVQAAWPPGCTPDAAEELARVAFASALPEPATVVSVSLGGTAVGVIVTPENGHPLHPMHVHVALSAARQALAERLPAEQPNDLSVIPLSVVGTDGIVRERLDDLNELLETLLQRKLGVNFQPIVNLGSGDVYGYEALIRAPQAGRLKRMGNYYRAADHARVVSWLDMACLEECLQEASRAGVREHLFVNLDAEGMAFIEEAAQSLSERVEQVGLSPGKIVVEITERQSVTDFPRLAGQIAGLRRQGFKIAIDDAGEGYSTLASIADVRPEFVKVGRPLVRSIENNGGRRALLEAINGFATRVGASVIAEGIETSDELATVIEIGVAFGQGYLLSKPKDSFRGLRRDIRDVIAAHGERRRARVGGRQSSIGAVARQGIMLPPDAPVELAQQKLGRNPDLDSIVVVQEGCPVGLIMRHRLGLRLAASPDIGTLPVSAVMERHLRVVEADRPIQEVAHQVALRESERRQDDVIVVRAGQVVGVAPWHALLEAMVSRDHVQRQHTNPLSGLPDRVLFEQEANRRLSEGDGCALVAAQIVGMAALNRHRGLAAGDDLIRLLGGWLGDLVCRDASAHAGHLSGCGFRVLLANDAAPAVCEAMHRAFGVFARQVEGLPAGSSQAPLCSLRLVCLRDAGRRARTLDAAERLLQTALAKGAEAGHHAAAA